MTARYLKFKPADGAAVLARGRLDLYEGRGELQMIVEHLEPRGFGALQFAFEQLKTKLAAEGLFDASRKRPPPSMPERIGIVTSPTGAVIRDMIQVLDRRCPGRHIRLYPAQVQGETAAAQIAQGIAHFSRSAWPEVVIVARGGGSLEDLWAFNEETVARAIAASAVPVISAVGHETDFTIADFVADVRAATPSAAAEMVIASRASLTDRLAAGESKLRQAARLTMARLGRRLHTVEIDASRLHRLLGRRMQDTDDLEYRMKDRMRAAIERRRRALERTSARLQALDVRVRLAQAGKRLSAADAALVQAMRSRLGRAKSRLDLAQAHLAQLSPMKILERGYALVLRDGNLVKSPADAPAGSGIDIRLAQGEISATVE
jgi:exodeoxyribonuclease VII large subunit